MLNKSKFLLYAAIYKFSAEANISANIDFVLVVSYRQKYLYVSNWHGYYIFSLCALTCKISQYIFETQYCVSINDQVTDLCLFQYNIILTAETYEIIR